MAIPSKFGLWRDNWHPVKHKPWVISPCLDEDSEAKVSIFIDQENRLLREDVLENYLFDFEVKIVKPIPLCRTQQGDILTWPQNPNGEYTVKSGYNFLQTKFRASNQDLQRFYFVRNGGPGSLESVEQPEQQ